MYDMAVMDTDALLKVAKAQKLTKSPKPWKSRTNKVADVSEALEVRESHTALKAPGILEEQKEESPGFPEIPESPDILKGLEVR